MKNYIVSEDLNSATDFSLLAVAVYQDEVVDENSSLTLAQRLTGVGSYFSDEMAAFIGNKYEYVDSMDDLDSDFQAVSSPLFIQLLKKSFGDYREF